MYITELYQTILVVSFPSGSVGKNPLANAGDVRHKGSILGSGRSPEEGNGSSLQYSYWDRGAWQATSVRSQELDMTLRLNNNSKILIEVLHIVLQ